MTREGKCIVNEVLVEWDIIIIIIIIIMVLNFMSIATCCSWKAHLQNNRKS